MKNKRKKIKNKNLSMILLMRHYTNKKGMVNLQAQEHHRGETQREGEKGVEKKI
jgi:hypothetical protein